MHRFLESIDQVSMLVAIHNLLKLQFHWSRNSLTNTFLRILKVYKMCYFKWLFLSPKQHLNESYFKTVLRGMYVCMVNLYKAWLLIISYQRNLWSFLLPTSNTAWRMSVFGPYFPAFGLNTDQKNSEYGHFPRSVNLAN